MIPTVLNHLPQRPAQRVMRTAPPPPAPVIQMRARSLATADVLAFADEVIARAAKSASPPEPTPTAVDLARAALAERIAKLSASIR